MRILVTGGAGFIGSHIVNAYLAQGHTVAVVDNLSPQGGGKLENIPHGIPFYNMDVSDPTLSDVFEAEQPVIVNHHAAQLSVRLSTDNPSLDAQTNIIGLLNVLENCRQYGVGKIIFASSGATYGAPLRTPMNEETPQLPESPYGITKMAGEHYLRYYQRAYNLEYIVFRYANIYGPRQNPYGESGVVSIFVRCLLTGQPIRIDWDGEQARDYLYVEDVVRANLLALQYGQSGGHVYCLGTGVATSVNALHEKLVKLTGLESPVIHSTKRPGDVHLAYFDPIRARVELGWSPLVSLNEGLQLTVDFMRQTLAKE